MGMRASAIEKLLQSRKNRPETSFSEMGKRPPLAGGEMRALASALSGMSASAGTYGGVTPKNIGFNESLNALDSYEKRRDEELMSNIKVAGLADEEAARSKPIDELTRKLMQQKLAELPLDGFTPDEIPKNMTRGQLEDNPVLGQILKNIVPKKSLSIRDQILAREEKDRQERMNKPVTDIDRKFLMRKAAEVGIEDLNMPLDYTYGDVAKNNFFKNYVDKMRGFSPEGLTPEQEERFRIQREKILAREKEQRERANLTREQIAAREKQQREEIAARERAAAEKRKNEKEKQEAALRIPGYERDKSVTPSLTDVKKARDGAAKLESLEKNFASLIEMIDEYGTTGLKNILSDPKGSLIAKGKLETLSNQLNFMLKSEDFANLGVLTGPDLELLRKSVPDVGSIKSGAFMFTDKTKAQINETLRVNKDLMIQKLKNLGYQKKEEPNKFPMTIRKDGQQATVNNEQELKEARAEGWK